MIIDFKDYSPNAVYHLMTQAIVPRPIAWILTQNADGKTHNLAPFSYFSGISSNPPLLLFSAMPKDINGTPKDTVENIRREKQFVVHIADNQQLAAVEKSAEPLDYGESEVAANHLTLCAFEQTGLQRLTDAPIAMACTLYQEQSVGDTPQTLIFGRITHLYVNDLAANSDGKRIQIDAEILNPLARLGAGKFAHIETASKVSVCR